MPVDYSKWDLIEDEDDLPVAGEGLPTREPPKRKEPLWADKQAYHDESVQLLAEWLKQAYSRQTDGERTAVVDFIIAQHKGSHPNNIARHREIIAFLKKAETEKTMPEKHALIAIAKLAQKRMKNDEDDAKKQQAERVFMVSMCALNTLEATLQEGGADNLFEQLMRSPSSESTRKYVALQYALDLVTSTPEDPRDAAEAAADALWWSQVSEWWKSPKGIAAGGAILACLLAAYLSLPEDWEEKLKEMLPEPPPEHGALDLARSPDLAGSPDISQYTDMAASPA